MEGWLKNLIYCLYLQVKALPKAYASIIIQLNCMSPFMSPSVKKYNTIYKNKEKAINTECFSNCKKFQSQLSVSAADLSISIVNSLVLEMQVSSVPSVVGVWPYTGPPVNRNQFKRSVLIKRNKSHIGTFVRLQIALLCLLEQYLSCLFQVLWVI